MIMSNANKAATAPGVFELAGLPPDFQLQVGTGDRKAEFKIHRQLLIAVSPVFPGMSMFGDHGSQGVDKDQNSQAVEVGFKRERNWSAT
jgi:hypothetical protein